MKKTICSILVAFLFASGCTKPEALLNTGENQLKAGTINKTVPMSFKEAFTSTAKIIPIECDGIVTDHLSGTLDVFCRMYGYYPVGNEGNDNAFVSEWMIHNYTGTLTSTSGSGEVFDIQGVKKMDMIAATFTFHLNVKGNMGSHYILFASGTNALPKTETSPGQLYTFTIEKAVCPGNAPGE
jgi:hypothetical protein